jgi:predicted RecA/RadA family phage recombinase
MTNAIPIRVVVDGSGDTTGLSEFRTNETVGLNHGGTGATNAADARTNLGLADIAASGSWADLLNKPNTDGIQEGTTNLYFTDERVDDRVAALIVDGVGIQKNYDDAGNLLNIEINFSEFDTDDIIEGSVNTFLANRSTSDIPEGTNLYFTDERVDDRVAALFVDGKGIQKAYDDAGNLLNIAIDFSEFDTDDIVEGTVNTFLSNRTTDDVVEGSNNLYYTDARVDTRIALQIGSNLDLSQKTTTDLTEGTNLYYTDARVDANFATKTTTDLTEGTNLYYTEARFDTRLATKSTTDLAEGANLYFTEERVDDRVAALIQAGEDISVIYDDVNNTLTIALASSIDGINLSNNTTDDLSEGSTNLYYTDSRVNIAFDTRLATKSTTDLSEGTNLYYTDARVDSNFAAKTTTDLTEGTNLYYTEARFDTRLATKSTTDLTEGTNLYYTDARVATYLNNNDYTTTSTVAAQIASVLSDLDDEIYDREQADLNLQSQIDNLVLNDLTDVNASSPTSGDALVWNGTSWVPQAPFSQTDFDSAFAAKTTTDLTEGTNLYYTDARVRSHVEGQDLDLGSNKILFSNVYANIGDLPSASSYHGMFAHVHGTGKAYYAHAGNWIELANNTDLLTSTDDLPEGSTNLYYTDTRVRSAISATTGVAGYVSSTGVFSIPSSTDHISEGTNLYYTDTRFDARLATKSTTDLSEGTNLYYTDARVDSNFATKTTTDLTEGTNLYYTDARVDANIASKTTDDVAEGSTNLYYTDARVATYISGNRTYGNITTTGYIAGPATLTIDPAGVGDNTGKVVIAGDLQVTGTTTTINSTTVEVGDLNIVLGSGATNAAAANGGGITIDLGTDGSASFTYNSTTDEFLSNKDINANITGQVSDISNHTTTDLAEGTNLYYTQSRFDTAFGVKSTTDLTEGTNLYYTQSRFDTAFGVKSTTDLTEGTNLYYTDARVDSNFTTKTTTDLTEGTNLYYTQARFDTAFATKDTDDLTEGSTNLYYTDARVNTWAVANLANVAFSGSYADLSNTPTDLSDFTDATGLLDIAAITVGDVTPSNPNDGDLWFDSTGLKTFIYYNDGTSSQWVEAAGDGGASVQSSSTAPSSPSDGDLWFNDNNLKLYIYYNDGSSAQWVEASGGIAQDTDAIPEGNNNLYYTDTRVDTRFATKDTDDLVEGSTNLYYTDARVDARIASSSSLGSTDNLPEGSTNLYYTDARVQAVSINEIVEDITPTLGGNLNANTFNITNISADGYSLPVADGANRQVIMTDGSGTLSFENLDTIHTEVTNQTGSTILKGTPVYQTGTSGNAMTIAPADASSSATMPAVGVLEQDLVSGATGFVIHMGKISGVDTSAFNEGDTIYVAVGGGYTNTPPVGESNLLQNLGRVAKVHASNGGVVIMGAGRTNAVSNLNDGNIFIGDSNNQATTASLNTSVQNYLSNLSGSIVPDTNVTYDLGSNTNRFKDIYLSESSIYLGTLQLSDNNGALEVTASGSTEAFATETYVDTAVANLVDSSPTTLDTLNELAAALGDDPNFSTTITNLIGTKLATADFNTTADSWLTGKTTTDLTEGTNLYYTDARVDARITASNPYDSSDFDANFSGKSTTDLTEGTNLYYTDARVRDQLYSTVSVTTSSGNFYIDGEQQGIVTLQPGRTYRFDQSDASNNSHPLRFSEVPDGTHAGGGATAYTTGVTVNGTAGNAGAYVEFVVTNATPRLYYYCANHSGMGGKVSVGKEMFVERITSDTWITGPIQTTTLNLGTGGSINAALGTMDFSNSTVVFSGANITGLSNSDVGLANIADNAQGVVVNGKVAAGSLDIGTSGSINAQLATLDFRDTLVNFSGATVGGLDDTIQDEVDFHLNKNNSSGATIISDGEILSWNATGGLQGTGDYEWINLGNEINSYFDTRFATKDTDDLTEGSTNLYYTDARVASYLSGTGYATTSYVAAQIASVSSDLDDEVYDREQADLNLQSQIDSLTTNIGTLVLDDLSDVDTTTTAPTNGQTLIFNGTTFVPGTISGYTSTDFDTDFATKSTTDLSEGTNLYYTDARVRTHIQGADLDMGSNKILFSNVYANTGDLPNASSYHGMFAHVHGTGKSYYAHNGQWVELANQSELPTSTDDVSEGSTNLYYTDARFDARLATKSTTDISEGTNLYYTDARVDARITASNPYDSSDFDTDFTTKSTTDLSEGTNLYYTDTRVQSYLTAQGIAAETLTSLGIAGNVLTYTDEDGNTTNIDLSLYLDDTNLARLVSGTLNGTTGIATFTRDDATTFTIDFSPLFDDTNLSRINSATFTNGTLTLTRDDASTGATVSLDGRYLQDLSGLTTDDLTEGSTNLYYTQSRFDSAFATKSTTDLTEGTNLYYTDTRVDARIAAANIVSGSSIDDLSDVDTSTTTPTDGQALVWDNTNSKWVPGASAGSSIDVSDIAPSSPSDGDLWFDSSELKTYIYYNDGTSSQWVEAAGNVASTPQWQEQSADYTASAGDKLFVDCSSSAVTVTLPLSPTQGDEIRIIDATGNASINNITINRNGSNIQGTADNLIIETDRAAFGLVYYNTTQGWLLMER